MMQIHRIVNTIFNSCTYIAHEKESTKAFIIDCGDSQPIIDYIQQYNLSLEAIIITHSHYDHIYGLEQISKLYPNAKIFTSENGVEGLRNPKLNISRYHQETQDISFKSEKIQVVKDNDIIRIADVFIKVIYTPGHDWSCISILCGDVIFTGDSYIPGVKVVTQWPKSNKLEAQKSLDILKEYESAGIVIIPGHILR